MAFFHALFADSKFTSIYIAQLFRSVQNALFPGKARAGGRLHRRGTGLRFVMPW